MDSLRLAPAGTIPALLACCRCGASDRPWDRMASRAYCPNCQELLALGESDPLVEPTERRRCAVCSRLGTLCFHSFPLHGPAPVAIDLCPEHLRGLIGRRLGPYAFHQLRRLLNTLGLSTEELFLLHSAFYDADGHALHPAVEIS
jgi:hypothetical protein